MQPLANGYGILVGLLRNQPEFEADLALGLLRAQLKPLEAWLRPLSVSKGVVTIASAGAAWRKEAEPVLRDLLPRINQRFGRTVVHDLEWVPLKRSARQDMLQAARTTRAPDTDSAQEEPEVAARIRSAVGNLATD